MAKEWRCKRCGTLLGVEVGARLHLRYKQAQYVVDGGDYNVIAVCRTCFTVNDRHAEMKPPPTIAAKGK